MKLRIWHNYQFNAWQPNFWDVIALLLVLSVIILLAWAASQISTPYHLGEALSISLNPKYLPRYALRSIFRILTGLFLSLAFTFVVGSAAAKNKHIERIAIPLIDILQSIPVLGYLSITIVIFIYLFPNSLWGPEWASIFMIFTAQAWNMCLGFYQSIKTIPYDLREASAMFQLSAWQRFWRLEVPFAMPSLMWNSMMSMSASWFFLVASEALTVNKQSILLPGIGSYIGAAILNSNILAVGYAITAMLIVILLFDQLLFRPLLSWSEKFKVESTASEKTAKPLLVRLLVKTHWLQNVVGAWFNAFCDAVVNFKITRRVKKFEHTQPMMNRSATILIYTWYITIATSSIILIYFLMRFIFHVISTHEILHILLLGVYTSARVIILIALASAVWVPIGVWIGLRPRATHIAQPIAQFFAAFPANLFFAIVVIVILKYHLNVNIWTTPLMILGTQWYILFNVIAGTTALPKDLVMVSQNLGLKKWLWWKRFILPGIFPYFITGAITAAGGAWNASIVAEVVSWGNHTLVADGLGAYIKQFTALGDFPRIALGISMMCVYVLIFNRLIWQPLYNLAEKRFQIN